jgi:hypothetical protein
LKNFFNFPNRPPDARSPHSPFFLESYEARWDRITQMVRK